MQNPNPPNLRRTECLSRSRSRKKISYPSKGERPPERGCEKPAEKSERGTLSQTTSRSGKRDSEGHTEPSQNRHMETADSQIPIPTPYGRVGVRGPRRKLTLRGPWERGRGNLARRDIPPRPIRVWEWSHGHPHTTLARLMHFGRFSRLTCWWH